jgi:hypothetical protein
MLYLKMFRGSLSAAHLACFRSLKARLGEQFKPLLSPAVDATARVLDVPAEQLRKSSSERNARYEPDTVAVDGEIFTAGSNLLVVSISDETERRIRSVAVRASLTKAPEDRTYLLTVSSIGAQLRPASLDSALEVAKELLARRSSGGVLVSIRNLQQAQGRRSRTSINTIDRRNWSFRTAA